MKYSLKSTILFFAFAFLQVSLMYGQLVVNTGMTPQQYVQDILVGSGVTVSNVTFDGEGHQIGGFDANSAAIDINEGIILGTGDVTFAVGPNNSTTNSLGGQGFTFNPRQDPDLNTLVSQTGKDAAILEFDFIPTGDSVSFRYIFASEEYLQYVNSGFNDAFGFFISGPGISGPFSNSSKNIALVPGTTTPITINTINNVINSNYYVNNPVSSTNINEIEYNGRTVVLTAKSAVQCGQTYHIKISIQDMADGGYDSGIFLEAGSFSTNGLEINSSINLSTADSVLYEGCGSAFLGLKRTNVSSSLSIPYSVIGTVDGSDYSTNSSSIDFPVGTDSVTLIIDAIDDAISEGLEDITIEIYETVCGQIDTHRVSFYIGDYTPLQYTMHDTSMSCNGVTQVPVWVDVNYDYDYTVSWDTGQNTDTIWVLPAATTTYQATITSDACGGSSVIGSATVTVPTSSAIGLNLPNDTVKVCPLDSFVLHTGVLTPVSVINWSSGETTDAIKVSPQVTTTYTVTVSNACGVTESGSVVVNVSPYQDIVNTVVTQDTEICSGDSVTIDAQVLGGSVVTYAWGNGLGSSLSMSVSPVVTTTYVLKAQDACNEEKVDSVVVTVKPNNLTVSLSDYSMNCLKENIVVTPVVSNPTGAEQYLWSTGETTASITVVPDATKEFWVEVTDECVSISDTLTVSVPAFSPVVVTHNVDSLLPCVEGEMNLVASVSGGSGTATVRWTDGVSFYSNNDNVSVSNDVTFEVYVVDACAFDGDTSSFDVTIPTFDSFDVQVNDTAFCIGGTGTLNCVATGGKLPYKYIWDTHVISSTLVVSPEYTKTYSVEVEDACGVKVSAQANVTVHLLPLADFDFDFVDENTYEFTAVTESVIEKYSWQYDDGGLDSLNFVIHQFEFEQEHEVMLTTTSIYGCENTVVKSIVPPTIIHIPNSFSPNNDRINDVFKVKGIGVSSMKLYIYDRWGKKILETNDVEQGWDGRYGGVPAPTDVYVYRVEVIGFNSEKNVYTGNVNLLK